MRNKNNNEMATRIRRVIDSTGLTHEKIGEILGVSAQSVSNWVCGIRQPAQKRIDLMEKEFHIAPGYISGKTDAFSEVEHRLLNAPYYLQPEQMERRLNLERIETAWKNLTFAYLYSRYLVSNEIDPAEEKRFSKMSEIERDNFLSFIEKTVVHTADNLMYYAKPLGKNQFSSNPIAINEFIRPLSEAYKKITGEDLEI